MLTLFFALVILVDLGGRQLLEPPARLRSRKLFDWEKRGYALELLRRGMPANGPITIDYVMVFFIFALGWYMFISSFLGPQLDHRSRHPVLEQHRRPGSSNPETTQGLSHHRDRGDDAAALDWQVHPAHRPVLHHLRDPLAALPKPQKMDLGGEYCRYRP